MRLSDSEYQTCIDGLGLLEGEEIRLKYGCARRYFARSVTAALFLGGGASAERGHVKKGLLVFTNDNMIFMEQEGRSSHYAQALRVPLENISGVLSGGTVLLFKFVKIFVGIGGAKDEHEFVKFFSPKQPVHEIREEIERLLKKVRGEKKRLAQEALAKGTVPTMIFCRFCGARNKSDQSLCVNCGAPLTDVFKSLESSQSKKTTQLHSVNAKEEHKELTEEEKRMKEEYKQLMEEK